MIKYILFDLDGTILDFNMGEKDAFIKTINNFFDYKVKEEDIKKFSELNEYYFNEYKNKKMERKEFHFNRFNEILKYLGLKNDPVELNKYYVESLKYEAIIFDDVIEILDYLSNKYQLFIASNGMIEVQNKRLEISGLKNYFKKIYVSEDIGFNKPDIEFFNYIFNDLNDFNKDNYIIIGDRLDSDILGAINSNIHNIYVNRFNINDSNIKPEYEVIDLLKIKDILK